MDSVLKWVVDPAWGAFPPVSCGASTAVPPAIAPS